MAQVLEQAVERVDTLVAPFEDMLVASDDALDQYFMREPERLLSRAIEDAIVQGWQRDP